MTRRLSLAAIVVSTLLVAAAYGSAFLPGGTPAWGPWAMVLGLSGVQVAIMMLGAARGGAGLGRLGWPFAFVGLILLGGFALALGLPAGEAAGAPLYGGLPLRASIVLYGIGLLPIVILPVAYALTFGTQTLTADDVERVRRAGEAWARSRSAAGASSTPSLSAPRETAADDAHLSPAARR